MIKRNFLYALVLTSSLAGCLGPTTPQDLFSDSRSEFVQAEFELLTAGCKYDRKENRVDCVQNSVEHAQRLSALVDEYVRTGDRLLSFDRSKNQAFLTRAERVIIERKVGHAKILRTTFAGIAKI